MIFRSPHPEVTIPAVSLPELILDGARRYPDKPALIDGPTGRAYTFRDFADTVRRAAGGLQMLGMEKGDVVALVAPNSPEYGIAFLASALAGGINTTLNPSATPPEIEAQFRDSGTRFVFTVPEFLDKLPPDTELRNRTVVLEPHPVASVAPANLPRNGPIRFDALAGLSRPIQDPPVIEPETDVVVLPYSSGTTGVPKGVRLTHRNVVGNLVQIRNIVFDGNDTILGLLPFFHIYGLTVVLYLGLYQGSTNVTLPRFELPKFLDVMERYRVSHANLVPPLIQLLARNPGIDPARLAALRSVQSGAAPLAADTARRFIERFDCGLTQGYGLSEASPVTHIAPRGWTEVPFESIGPPVAGTECRIVDSESGVDLGPDRRGELHVRGPQVMAGYLNAPEKTARMIDPQGWLHTGDIATADARGNFFIVDRAKELIKYKGYAVAPAELEALLLKHPNVRDVAVVGHPDDLAGELPMAFVVPEGRLGTNARLGANELMSWVGERVAPQKKIRKVVFVDEIPKSASGKILRRLLRGRTGNSGDAARTAQPPDPGAPPP